MIQKCMASQQRRCLFFQCEFKGNPASSGKHPQEIACLIKGILITIVRSFSLVGSHLSTKNTALRVVHNVLPNQWSPHTPLATGSLWVDANRLKQQFLEEKPCLKSCHVPLNDIPHRFPIAK